VRRDAAINLGVVVAGASVCARIHCRARARTKRRSLALVIGCPQAPGRSRGTRPQSRCTHVCVPLKLRDYWRGDSIGRSKPATCAVPGACADCGPWRPSFLPPRTAPSASLHRPFRRSCAPSCPPPASCPLVGFRSTDRSNSALAACCQRVRAQLSSNARSLPGVCGRVFGVICSLNARLLGTYAAPPPATTARRRRPRPYKLPVVLDHKEMVVRTRTAQAVFTTPPQHVESTDKGRAQRRRAHSEGQEGLGSVPFRERGGERARARRVLRWDRAQAAR